MLELFKTYSCRISLLLLLGLTASCTTKQDLPDALKQKNRQLINQHVSLLAKDLVDQPVMTPRPGFSGYLRHFSVIRSTTKDSPYAVILDGEGQNESEVPSTLQAFVDLKGKHPYGGSYAFSGADKERKDKAVRLVLEIPGPNGDGKMAIAYADGSVVEIKAPPGKLTDEKILEILSVYGKPVNE